ncbi:MAG: GDSL-type esterase/lipase family protein, partial [Planctomycetota bacterium]|jgi:hypothetical protein
LQLGNPHRPEEIEHHCVGFIARNNFITRAPEAGIVTVYTKECKLLNNTIHEPDSRMGRLIRTVFTNDGLVIANNLISGPRMSGESGSKVTYLNNYVGDLTSAFVDPQNGDLHLKDSESEIVDRGIVLAEVIDDIDGESRASRPDIGADELTE